MPSPKTGATLPKEVTAELAKTANGNSVVPKASEANAIERWRAAREIFLLRATETATEGKDATKTKAFAVAAGIATEKVLLLENKPTAIIGGLQENRHMLPEVLAKLAEAASILKRDQNG